MTTYENLRERMLRTVLEAYADQRNHISDSDLDDEQPVSLSLRTTLGELRQLQLWSRTVIVIDGNGKGTVRRDPT